LSAPGGDPGGESGDREAFVMRLQTALAGAVPRAGSHPLPPSPPGSAINGGEPVPLVRSKLLDPADLVGSFVRNARTALATVHPIHGSTVPAELVSQLIERHHVSRAVVSAQPGPAAVGELLRAYGVVVEPLSLAASAAADLGVTCAVAAIATTGTIVEASAAGGGRSASLLPPVHLCVLAASRVIPSSAELFRSWRAAPPAGSNVVLITGPSRSADIEQTMAMGVHGPIAVEIALLLDA
jgi:L-lactate dehydrogenase complex protein LldG